MSAINGIAAASAKSRPVRQMGNVRIVDRRQLSIGRVRECENAAPDLKTNRQDCRYALTNSDLSSHAINQLLGIVANPSLKHRLDVLDLVNSF